MKLIKKDKQKIQFEDLNVGDVFIHDNHYYLKIDWERLINLDEINCINLSLSKVGYIGEKSDVVAYLGSSLLISD